MDPICHTLAGAALGKAGLARRVPRGMATLLVGANLPDVDLAAYALGEVCALYFRRGWTHGVLAMATWPLLLAATALAWERAVSRWRRRPAGSAPQPGPPARFLPLLLVATAGVWSHPLLDLLNVYGVRLLAPFSQRWFYGDALFIVDPWLWIVLGGGVWLSARTARRAGPARAESIARRALALGAAYAAGMAALGVVTRDVAGRLAVASGAPVPVRVMAAPRPIDPFARYVVVDVGARYLTGELTLLPRPRLGLSPPLPADPPSPVGAAAASTPRVRAFLGWARFPVFLETRGADGPALRVRDIRYPGRAGEWAGVTIPLPATPTPRSGGRPSRARSSVCAW